MIKVGIAEDHPIARRGLVDLLKTTDDIVLIGQASDGAGALELAALSNGEPDILLLDVRMPDVSGLEVTRRISEQHPSVQVIILTAMDDPRTVSEAVRAGAKGYVLKTAGGDEILETVRLVARGHVVIDSKAWSALADGEAQPKTSPRGPVSSREIEVLELIAEGHTNKHIAEELGLSPETVKTHVERIRKRFRAHDRTDAAVKALRAGIID